MADVSHTITTRGDLARRLREHAGKKLAREVLPDVARDAAERANAIFARDYRTVARRAVGEVRLVGVTGAGHGSIEAEIIGNELPAKLRVWSDVPHVVILNHGAKPHEITPVNARFLQFGASYFAPNIRLTKAALASTPRGTAKRFRRSSADFSRPGKIVRTDHVNHPGVKPGRFFERAVRQALENAFR